MGQYGKGKYCPPANTIPGFGPDKCMAVDDVDTFMAKSRDAKQLEQVWAGWHSVGAPMRPQYTQFLGAQYHVTLGSVKE